MKEFKTHMGSKSPFKTQDCYMLNSNSFKYTVFVWLNVFPHHLLTLLAHIKGKVQPFVHSLLIVRVQLQVKQSREAVCFHVDV